MAIPTGSPPILIGRPGTPVAVEIGVTVPAPEFATYAVDPSGVAAMAYGPAPVVIRGPAVLVQRPRLPARRLDRAVPPRHRHGDAARPPASRARRPRPPLW